MATEGWADLRRTLAVLPYELAWRRIDALLGRGDLDEPGGGAG